MPHDFTLGVATAAYQIEGTTLGTCGPSHWDSFARRGGTHKGHDGAVACAHYTHWEADLDLIKSGGFNAYRFSTAWPRIFPDGASGQANAQGLDFYDRLVDGCLTRGLDPHLTLYHWDLPQSLADEGGWENSDIAHWFADYATTVAARLGDRVASIATINEPWCVAWLSHYLDHHAPGKADLPAAAKAMHNVLYAHGTAVSALRAQGTLGGDNIGIVLNMEYAQPASDSAADQRAATTHDGIYNRWFIQALTQATYPGDILPHLAPHMPTGWQDQMGVIAQPLDWMGLNYYTRSIHADDGTGQFPYNRPVIGPLPKTDMGWEIYPQGLEYFLTRMHRDYTGDLPLYVTENGMAGADTMAPKIQDDTRIDYFDSHLRAVRAAMDNGAPVRGYFAWSLLDNFEWAFGYDKRFGIVYVDYATQQRIPKASFHALRQMADDIIIQHP